MGAVSSSHINIKSSNCALPALGRIFGTLREGAPNRRLNHVLRFVFDHGYFADLAFCQTVRGIVFRIGSNRPLLHGGRKTVRAATDAVHDLTTSVCPRPTVLYRNRALLRRRRRTALSSLCLRLLGISIVSEPRSRRLPGIPLRW